MRVNDEVDLFVNDSGVLVGLSRTFYKELPRFTVTQTYTFSDYRETGTGKVLLPYKIDRYLNGRNIESITAASYGTDVAPAKTLFEPTRKKQ